MTRLFAGTPFDREPTCEECGKPDAECVCPPPPKEWADPSTQKVRVQVEKRAKGKRATVVMGLSAETTDLPALLSDLQSACGTGGTVKDDQVELQGDQQAKVRAKLDSLGYRVK